MKKKAILIGVAFAGCALAAVAVHNIVQHARHDLVTLNVTGAPLAKVLARVTRQTGEPIVVDQNLGGTVTLNVHKAPLRQVLGQIADQVGGFARLNFTVGRSQAKLAGLQDALREGRDPIQVGWTNLTAPPRPPEGSEAGPRVLGPGPATAGDGRRRVEVRAERTSGPEARRVMVVSSAPDGITHTLDLSPRRLLLDSDLAANLTTDGPTDASAEAARQLARRTGGRADSFHTIEALPLPPGGLPPGLNRFSMESDEDSARPTGSPDFESMAGSVKRHFYDRLTRQTPEQRARAAGGDGSSGQPRLTQVEE